ncbi:hypothetical protein HXX76_008661 [Chlamydomonas incerta]|uniref:alpha-mannosidase n=1 Tax=Chlamydomonas incerta TaxID=51695 RepID=A0A835SW75_CHLIN|nr:hypothetical protein HXX76_008661 [Chlamydomonas incerta]|eukprot:KAG2432931.1 hypothetical protein HXX76_008661 [Chlamydomonas incerta]
MPVLGGSGAAAPPAPAAAPAVADVPGRWVPQHHRDITLGRLDGYLAAGQFADVNLRAAMWRRRSADAVSLEVYSHPKDVPYPPYDVAIKMPYRPTAVGEAFGPSWTTHWFRVRARVPADWAGEGPLMFRWDSGSEAMLYLDGPTPRQGITDQRNEYMLAPAAVAGQELVFYVEMAANGMFGNTTDGILPPNEDRYFTLKAAELAVPDLEVTGLYHDLRALTGLARELPVGTATGEAALYTANKIVNTYRRGDPQSVAACRALAASVLAVRDPGDRMQVHAVGHCHIDTAWLWPFSETHRKTARSWSSQLRLAERYPWHVFTASSAQQYEWLQQDYPGLFTEIQAAAGRGSFVPVGGTWVEMDTNVPSGESLVRQFLFGQRFFQRHFGAPCDVFWLPDTFGYSGQLPQIAAGAGIRYFLTQKLSWNNINTFPHTTFYWAGLDGASRLLTHFPPANTYNAQADAKDLLATATGSKDKDRAPAAYMLFGNGDGGGGPTVDMCESLARLGGCRGVAGSFGVTAPGDFFRRLEGVSQDLLTWRGELYFELHRGTYTSHAANKNDNRACELLLREAEAAGALAEAMLGGVGGYCYPRAELESIWKDVLLYQFHDVLPGSSIGRVYDVTKTRYPQMKMQLHKIRDAALGALIVAASAPQASAADIATVAPVCAGGVISLGDVAGARPLLPHPAAAPAAAAQADGAGEPVAWVFNSLALPRTELVSLPVASLPPDLRRRLAEGSWRPAVLGQAEAVASPGGAGGASEALGAEAVLAVVDVPPLSLTPLTAANLAAGIKRRSCSTSSSAAAGSSSAEGAGYDGGCRLVRMTASQAGLRGRRAAAAAEATSRRLGVAVAAADAAVYLLMNRLVRAYFDDAGRLLSLYDPAWRRELVPEGQPGNVFRLYEDIPLFWDAWDIEVYHLEKGWLAGEGMPPPSVHIIESTPSRVRLGLSMQLTAASSLQQVVSLNCCSARLEFHTEVVWAENRTALKVEFPTTLDAPAAAYEVQFGAVERPTHTNTSWDWARFEVCAHKWADLSEPGYGLTLLNDCKYGHAVHGHVMRLTLLRSPKAPDANTDMGTHALRYGLLPHAGSWQQAGVAAHGWAFNAPLRLMQAPPQHAADAPTAAAAAAVSALSLAEGTAAGTAGSCRAKPRLTFSPEQPMFAVLNAQLNPLQPAAPHDPDATSTGVWQPPLILDTVKLAEPPLQPAGAAPAAPAAPTATAGSALCPGGLTPGAAGAGVQQQQLSVSGVTAGGTEVVLRLYEPHGARGVARIEWPDWLPVAGGALCDLLEQELGPEQAQAQGQGLQEGEREEKLRVVLGAGAGAGHGGLRAGGAGGYVELPYKPFQLISIKLFLQD